MKTNQVSVPGLGKNLLAPAGFALFRFFSFLFLVF